MLHKSEVENYTGSMQDLAEEIGDLRYDALADFLGLLADKIQHDGEKDEARNRVQLADKLLRSAGKIKESQALIDRAWQICEPYMK